jgi:hypothetical protein
MTTTTTTSRKPNSTCLPDGAFSAPSPSSDNGEIATLFQANFPDSDAAVWMIPQRILLAKIPALLQAAIPEKLKERRDFAKYAIRPGSVDSTWIGGNEALRAMADYEEKGRQMSETLTWIYTEHTRAFFFARVEAAEMARAPDPLRSDNLFRKYSVDGARTAVPSGWQATRNLRNLCGPCANRNTATRPRRLPRSKTASGSGFPAAPASSGCRCGLRLRARTV